MQAAEAFPRDISLEEALMLANLQNLAIGKVKAGLSEKNWQLTEAISDFLPTLTPFYSRQRVDGTFIVGGIIPVSVNTLTQTVGVTTQATVFNGFRTTLKARSRWMERQATRADVTQTVQDNLLQTFEAYYHLLQTKSEVAIQEAGLKEAELLLHTTRLKHTAGTLAKVDILQAQAQQEKARKTLLKAQQAYQLSSLSLAKLLNISMLETLVPKEGAIQMRPLVEEAVLQKSPPFPEALIAFAVKQHPLLQKSQFELKALQSKRWESVSNVLPGVAFSYTTQATGRDLSALKNTQIYQVNMSLPLTGLGLKAVSQWGQGSAQLTHQQLVMAEIRQSVEEAVLKALLEIQTQRSVLAAAHAQLTAQDERVRLALLRYQAGLMTTLDLTTAQQQRLEAKQSVAVAVIDYNVAQARLLHALGVLSPETLLAKLGPWCFPALLPPKKS
jgi:outer membrane protein TolC